MKVLFINPPQGCWVYYGLTKCPNIGYAQLAGFLLDKTDLRVEVLDCRALDMDFAGMEEELKRRKPDVVAVGSGTAWAPHCMEAVSRAKKVLPKVTTVAGGLHFTALPEESMRECPEIDYVVVGEGEYTLLELLNHLQTGATTGLDAIKGLAYRNKNHIVVTEPRPLIDNLDDLPMPAFHLFPMEKYIGYTYWRNYTRVAVSRGCNGRCEFCYQWRQYDSRKEENIGRYRVKSGKRVVDEIEYLNRELGVKVFDFEDDEFNGDRRMMEELCDELLRRKLDVNWFFLGRADSFVRDIDLFPKMREAGCFQILVGIEVSSDPELEKMGKKISIAQIKEAVSKLRENGIAIIGTYMVGFWEDDEAIIKKRAAFIEEVDPDIMTLQILTPYPGTLLWDRVKDTPLLEDRNWKHFDMIHAIMPTKYLSRQDIHRLTLWSYREFYNKQERFQRILKYKDNPLAKLCFRNFLEVVPDVARCLMEGKEFL